MYGIVPGINACFSNMMMLLSKKKNSFRIEFYNRDDIFIFIINQ